MLRPSALMLAWLLCAAPDANVACFAQERVPTLPGRAGPLKVYVAAQGTPLRQRPDETSAALASANYLDDYYAAAEDATRSYYLLAKADEERSLQIGKKVGWIPRRRCLETVRDLPLAALRHPRTTIYRKAMLINRLDASQGVAGLQRPVEFLDRPDRQGRPPTSTAVATNHSNCRVIEINVSRDRSWDATPSHAGSGRRRCRLSGSPTARGFRPPGSPLAFDRPSIANGLFPLGLAFRPICSQGSRDRRLRTNWRNLEGGPVIPARPVRTLGILLG